MKERPPSQTTSTKNVPETPAPERGSVTAQNANKPLTEDERRERIKVVREWTRTYLERQYPEYGPNMEKDFFDFCRKNGLGNTPEETTASETQAERIRLGTETIEAFLHGIIDTMRSHADNPERLGRFTESLSENARFDRWGFGELDDAAFVSVYTDYERTSGLSESDTPFALMRTYFADRLTTMDDADVRLLTGNLSKRSPGERMDIIHFLPPPFP